MGGARQGAVLFRAAIAAVPIAILWMTAVSPAGAAAPTSCPGPADGSMTPLVRITGSFGTSTEGSFVYLPFEVPAGTTAVRVRYCHDQPESALPSELPNAPRHVLDLGLYDARPGAAVWGPGEFRGWGGSSVRDVSVSPNGYSSEAVYSAARKAHVHGRTTRAYMPGAIPAGQWAVELGVAAVASQQEGDASGEVAWRVEIDTSASSDWSNDPHVPAAYDAAPADPDPGWYAGDMHVHGEHEPGNALMRETFRYAFAPIASGSEGGAGLDFVTLVDHNNVNAYDEIGRFQDDHPGKLIARSTEVTTYRGHVQNHVSGDFVDYRTGPLLEASLTNAGGVDRTLGAMTAAGSERPAAAIFDEIHAEGGFTQINHPTIFPSAVPTFDDFCRGCPWDYSATETDYSKVDAIEIATGPAGIRQQPHPGPNPFTPLAVQFWEDALDTGAKIAAVGSSDSHQAGAAADDPADITAAPIGQASTVVFADELSEHGLQEGVEAGHTYVKIWGNDGPDLRFEAVDPDSAENAIMGDTVDAAATTFAARVMDAGPGAARPGLYTLVVFKDGAPTLEVPITNDDFDLAFPSFGTGRYRLQVMRLATGAASVENVSSPIYLEPSGAGPPDTDADDDGVDDTADNCPTVANAGQRDLDQDGLGDACDADRDGDAVADAEDRCLEVPGVASNGGCPAPSAAETPCRNLVRGTRAGERLTGTPAGDRLIGRRGDDLLAGRGGDDCLHGNKGADVLRGGPGDDLLRSRDRRRDLLRCGPGSDLALADRIDRVRGCERTRRRR